MVGAGLWQGVDAIERQVEMEGVLEKKGRCILR